MRQTFNSALSCIEHDGIMRYRAKIFAFTILQTCRLKKNDLFLPRYSFLLQMKLYRNSTSLTLTPDVDENFHRHFTICKTWFGKFSSTFSNQTKNFIQFFLYFFLSLGSGHVGGNFASANILLSSQ